MDTIQYVQSTSFMQVHKLRTKLRTCATCMESTSYIHTLFTCCHIISMTYQCVWGTILGYGAQRGTSLKYSPPRCSFKKLFLGLGLGEALQAIPFTKSVLEGLKWIECECGIGGKNSFVCYIPKQDPVQNALKLNKKQDSQAILTSCAHCDSHMSANKD